MVSLLVGEFVAHQPFERVDWALVPVWPNHGHCVVAFLQHVGGVHVSRHHVWFKNLAAVYFVNAQSTFAFHSHFIWVNQFLDGTLLGDYHSANGRIKLDLLLVVLHICHCNVDIFCYVFVKLDDGHRFRQSEDKWSTSIRETWHFFKDGDLVWILDSKLLN